MAFKKKVVEIVADNDAETQNLQESSYTVENTEAAAASEKVEEDIVFHTVEEVTVEKEAEDHKNVVIEDVSFANRDEVVSKIVHELKNNKLWPLSHHEAKKVAHKIVNGGMPALAEEKWFLSREEKIALYKELSKKYSL